MAWMEAFPGLEKPGTGSAPTEATGRYEIKPALQAFPFWTLVGGWSVLCGALATNPLHWRGEIFLIQAIAFLLVTASWAGLWTLASGIDWAFLLHRKPDRLHAPLPVLPYTRPGSPAGRLARRLGPMAGWWVEVFWPVAGPSFVLILLAALSAAILSLLLPPRVWWLDLALVALVALGMIQRRRGLVPLAAQAFLGLGLPWLAGYLAVARFSWPALLIALVFSLAAWGLLRVERRMAGGTWLLHGGLLGAAALLVILRQPLAAGGTALLAFGPALSGRTLGSEEKSAGVSRRIWPWLLAAMLVASLASP
ncbi:MAG TPA: hypothetical protein PKO09_13580 [Anaerolineae bacterium]|nr:hypothetical protein [Anaerolineae bacterium]